MVSSISGIGGFSAINTLSSVKPVAKTEPVAKKTETPQTESTSPAPSSTPLQSGNAVQLSSAVLAILQDNAPGKSSTQLLASQFETDTGSDITSSLFGSGNATDLLSSLFSGASGSSDNLFQSLLQDSSTKTAPLQQAVNSAQQSQANTKAQQSPVQDLLSSTHTGVNAYNKILIQTAQAAINASNLQSLTA